MTIRMGVVMDPIATTNYKKDSTLAMLWAAAERGWQIHYMEQSDLFLVDGAPFAEMTPLQVFRDPEAWYRLGEPVTEPLESLDVVLMRKDPPFNNEYIYSTYILEAAQRRGCLIVNDPRSLRDCNEKLYATNFPQCCPPLLVSRDLSRLRAFHQLHGDVVFKPLDGMGGSMIFRVRGDDLNLNAILEAVTDFGRSTIMAQRYLPEITDGDKRILVIDGKPVDYCLARVPACRGEPRQPGCRGQRQTTGLDGARPLDMRRGGRGPSRQRPYFCRSRRNRRLPDRDKCDQPHVYSRNRQGPPDRYCR